MERSERIRADQRTLSSRAFERWKAFQSNLTEIENPTRNLDGSIPHPTIAAVTSEQRMRFQERQRHRAAFDSPAYREMRRAAERQIGATLDFVDLPPNDQALKAGRPVVRIVTLTDDSIVPEGFATGFLVAPQLILTNYHVFRTADEARGTGAQFLYEHTDGGLRKGLIFALDPDRFFLNHKGFDYAFVAVQPKSRRGADLSQFKYLPLIGVKGKILKGDPVNIIQHPEGRPKQYATVNNRLLDIRDDGFLIYETDTLVASSGSPAFNQQWEIIALHHCGVPLIEKGKLVTRDGRRVALDAEVADSDLIWIGNEGIRISKIVESLKEQRFDDPGKQGILAELIRATQDPLRRVAEKSPLVSPSLGNEWIHRPEQGTAMAQNLFQFTGPVTFQINPPVSQPTTAATSEAPALISPGALSTDEYLERKLKFDENYRGRTKLGYKADFLKGWKVPAPKLNNNHAGQVLLDDRDKPWVIPYYHYSLVMNRSRRLLSWAAGNVDYGEKARKYTKTRKEYGGEDWRLDPRVALEAPGMQIEDAHFYAPAKKIDRGHIVRREDSAWGKSLKEAEFGNSDTYHWTNCTPQSEAFNQSKQSGIWGKFEEHIQREVKAVGGRMTIFAGPVLNPRDPEHGYDNGPKLQVPMEFWKLVLCVSKEEGESVRRAYGFVFDQTEPVQRLGYERMNMDDYEIYQMPIAEITRKTGVEFDASVLQADVLKDSGANESLRGFQGKTIKDLAGIVLR